MKPVEEQKIKEGLSIWFECKKGGGYERKEVIDYTRTYRRIEADKKEMCSVYCHTAPAWFSAYVDSDR